MYLVQSNLDYLNYEDITDNYDDFIVFTLRFANNLSDLLLGQYSIHVGWFVSVNVNPSLEFIHFAH